MPWFAGILFLVALVALLAVARRRTHDRGINPRRFAVLALLALLTVVPFTPAF